MAAFPLPPRTTHARAVQGFFPGSRPRLAPPPGRAGEVQCKVLGAATQIPAGLLVPRPAAAGKPLPEVVQRSMEALFGAGFSDVRIHVGPEAAAIGALAFTLGSDLYFAPGQYDPGSPHGRRLLGHELAHVVQQRTGRVRNPFGHELAVVQDPNLEAEAERMGLRAVTFVPAPPPAVSAPPRPHSAAPAAGRVQPFSLRPPRPVAPAGVAQRRAAGPGRGAIQCALFPGANQMFDKSDMIRDVTSALVYANGTLKGKVTSSGGLHAEEWFINDVNGSNQLQIPNGAAIKLVLTKSPCYTFNYETGEYEGCTVKLGNFKRTTRKIGSLVVYYLGLYNTTSHEGASLAFESIGQLYIADIDSYVLRPNQGSSIDNNLQSFFNSYQTSYTNKTLGRGRYTDLSTRGNYADRPLTKGFEKYMDTL